MSGVTQRITVASGRASVRFSSGTPLSQIDAELSAVGAIRSASLGGGWYGASWTDGAPVSAKLPLLQALQAVTSAEPSKAYRPFHAPNDALFNSQYALSQVQAPAGWDFETGFSTTVTIAVIDAGIDGTHPELSGKMGNGLQHQFCDPGPNKLIAGDDVACAPAAATPACNHATHVAGVAAASTDNGAGVAGMSWGAQLLSLKVFRDVDCPTSDCSDSTCQTDDWAIANAINFAVGKQNQAAYGHIVINMSLGSQSTCSGTIQSAVNNALAVNIPVIAAAGNSGGTVSPGINSPGNCAGVVPMGATDNTGQVASFSSNGPELASNGLVAPGVSVLTTDVGGGYASATGTSFASPMGAGLAALLLSQNPSRTPTDVKTLMRGGAQSIGQSSTVQGAGQMNVYRSLRLAVKGTLAGFDGDQKPIAFPNPFRLSQGTSVTISIPTGLAGSGTDIKIYTMAGRFVRELSEPLWDGKNADGRLVASGTYMFVVKTSAGSSTGRMAVIR